MNRKMTKKNLTFQSGDSNPRFSVIFLSMICILTEGEDDELKSKQASKKDRTLPSCSTVGALLLPLVIALHQKCNPAAVVCPMLFSCKHLSLVVKK
jgi:hypothetical protein